MKAKEFRLTANESEFELVSIHNEQKAAEYARQFYFDDINIYESVFVILMNRANKTIGWFKVSQGGIDCSIIDSRLITKVALDALASGVILVHNHPSGNCLPSEADVKQTESIKDCLNVFGIQLIDHIILTENEYYSFNSKQVSKG